MEVPLCRAVYRNFAKGGGGANLGYVQKRWGEALYYEALHPILAGGGGGGRK